LSGNGIECKPLPLRLLTALRLLTPLRLLMTLRLLTPRSRAFT